MFSTENHRRGNITFFSTYRPPVPLEIYSSPVPPSSKTDELQMLDGISYNYNGQVIPPSALKTILTHTNLHRHANQTDVGSGRVTGLVFVSERTDGLETLHVALRFEGEAGNPQPRVEVFNFADVYGTFSGVRMEDSGCVAGGDDDHLVYVSTKDPADRRRQPWTAVYKTSLKDGRTHRLTPSGVADLSPAVSPSGKKIAVASFEEKGGWDGEIEDLMTDIFVMNVHEPHHRTLVIENGGWPTWGCEDILFFHRKVGDYWAVFRADLSKGTPISDVDHVTPEGIDAMTPVAIDNNCVAVATIRQKSQFGDVRVEAQYRHVEIFDSLLGPDQVPIQITQKTKPLADHFNPFVIVDRNGVLRIGYHRCQHEQGDNDFPSQISGLKSPQRDVGACRVAGAFPSFSKDGTKMAFVDNEFKAVYLADYKIGIRPVYQGEAPDSVFSPVWNQNPEKDTLYVCMGKSFKANTTVHICAITNVSTIDEHSPLPSPQPLTIGESNNAFPSTNAQGTRLVFRSTRDGGENKYKNLYIMEDAQIGEHGGKITRLTNGPWTDTHCEWSPNQDWIVFSSTRDKPQDAPEMDNGLDPGYFAVFLVKANDPDTVIRVLGSGHNLAGHVNHPFFSPDARSIVMVSDLAGVSVDPISLPLFLHSVRPYGDIFTVDIDPKDIKRNKDLKKFNRVTHSRFENSTASWAMVTLVDLNRAWELIARRYRSEGPFCPYLHHHGGHTFHLTGHIHVPNRLC